MYVRENIFANTKVAYCISAEKDEVRFIYVNQNLTLEETTEALIQLTYLLDDWGI